MSVLVRKAVCGFTLIEVLIVVGLLGVFAAVATDTFTNIMRAQNKTRVINELEQSGNHALSVMEQEIRDAESVDCTGEPERITIKSEEGEEIAFKWIWASGMRVPAREVIGEAATPLVNSNRTTGVQLTGAGYHNLFSCEESRVTITLELIPGEDAPSRSDFTTSPVQLRTTVVVRGSYE